MTDVALSMQPPFKFHCAAHSTGHLIPIPRVKALASRMAVDATQPPIQWILAALPAGILVVVVAVH